MKLPDAWNRKVAKLLALELYGYSHLTVHNMDTICKRAHLMTKQMNQSIESVIRKCSSFKYHGKPLLARKIFFKTILM